jgi:hypothetical protein
MENGGVSASVHGWKCAFYMVLCAFYMVFVTFFFYMGFTWFYMGFLAVEDGLEWNVIDFTFQWGLVS